MSVERQAVLAVWAEGVRVYSTPRARRCALVFFFFQAEDGIRDHCVTGVQTCALPICARRRKPQAHKVLELLRSEPVHPLRLLTATPTATASPTTARRWHTAPVIVAPKPRFFIVLHERSEERRVGKECRARGGPSHCTG